MDEENKIIKVYERATGALERRRPALPTWRETAETEETPDLRVYLQVIRKRRLTVLTTFFIFFTIVLIWTLKQKTVYRAQALVEIQKENPDIPSVKELFELDTVSDTFLETQYKVLQSDSLARRAIDQLHLDQFEEFNRPKLFSSWRRRRTIATSQDLAIGGASSERDSDTYQNTLERFRDRLTVEPVKRSRLVAVRFESQERELAASVVNTLCANYIEQSLEARWEATQKASEWLSHQLLGLKGRLEKSEDELQSYTRRNGLLFLETDKGNTENVVNERLRQLQEELTKAQAARYEKESLGRLVQVGDYGSLPGIFENKLMQDLTVRLAELKREYAQLTTTFNADYPKVQEIHNQIEEVEAVLEHERKRAAERITNDYLAAVRRENLVRQAFEEQQVQVNRIAEKAVQYNILKREVETNKQMYQALLQRLKEAGVSAGLKATNIRIVDPAEPPRESVRPQVLLSLGLALILGLGLGLGAAFLQEHLDNTLKSTDAVEAFLGLPALALIPSVESLDGHRRAIYGLLERTKRLTAGKHTPTTTRATQWHRVVPENGQQPTLSEAFRSLRTSLLLSTADHPPRSLLLTSAQPGEGKTTIATNLAISLAQLGRRVLLIDADMRRPCVHLFLEVERDLGLVSYLTGQQEWRASVHPTGLFSLDALLCGPVPPNPAELLSSERMQELIGQATGEYSFVVIDSAPLLNVADSRILATLVDGVALVVNGRVTARELVRRAQGHVREVGANLIGVVLNNVDPHAGDDYYRYSYYDEYRP